MSVPQIKDRPASALRAMFAGIGSLLTGKSGKSGKDKMRAAPAAEAPADAQAPAPEAAPTTAAPEAVAAEATAAPETAVTPDTAAAPEVTAEPEVTVQPEATTEPQTTEPQTTAGPEATAEPGTVSALPLPNYDELTVGSLRARLRNLSNDDLIQLKEYEQAHQNRAEVVKMFQNRLLKMTSGMPKLES